MISQYWVGQIPMNNLQINVLRADGYPADCTSYSKYSARMLGTDNEEIDLKGGRLDATGASAGFFIFEWPRNRSLFTKPGEYVFQLVLETSREVFVYDDKPPTDSFPNTKDPYGGVLTPDEFDGSDPFVGGYIDEFGIWHAGPTGTKKGFVPSPNIGIVPPPGHYETAFTKDITTEHVIRVRELGGKK